jgi:hypothetical protein
MFEYINQPIFPNGRWLLPQGPCPARGPGDEEPDGSGPLPAEGNGPGAGLWCPAGSPHRGPARPAAARASRTASCSRGVIRAATRALIRGCLPRVEARIADELDRGPRRLHRPQGLGQRLLADRRYRQARRAHRCGQVIGQAAERWSGR